MSAHIFQSSKEQLSAVIFDMDGVLVLSSAIHAAAFAEALAPLAVTFDYRDYAGMRTREAIEAIACSNGLTLSSAELEELARQKSAAALRRVQSENPLHPAARQVLEYLYRQYPLALATSASESTVNAVVGGNSLTPYFRCILTGSHCRSAKPSPEIYLKTAGALGVESSTCLVVEDALAGITAAKAAGAVCAAVAGTLPAEQLRNSGADVVLSNLSELMEL